MLKSCVNKRLLILYLSIMALNFGFGMIDPILPLYIKHYGISAYVIGLIMSAYSFGRFLFQGVGGVLSDKFVTKKIAATGIAIYAPGMFIQAFFHNQYFFVIGRVIEGMAEGISMPALYSLISRNSNEENIATSFGLFTTFASLGLSIGPFVGGIISDPASYQYLFVFTGIIAIICAIIIMFMPLDNGEWLKMNAVNDKKLKGGYQLKDGIKSLVKYKFILKPLLPVLIYSFLTKFIISALRLIVPLYATSQLKETQSYVGLLFTLNYLLYSICQPVMGVLCDKLLGKRDVFVGALLFSVVYVMYPLIRNSLAFLFVFCLGSASSALLTVAMRKSIAKLHSQFENMTGRSFGVFGIIGDVGSLVGPVVASLFAYKYFFIMFAIICILTFILLTVDGKRRLTHELPNIKCN